ncbi:Octaheme tetrathionate reductase [Caenispirillum salinarum AK4]|uniref:Octaheme tetrathionate reductase n=1 Tax=Caenispirillum salinarum AK4 TaxID=1238182 RepID=K9H6X9_9PROT|nr:tetrathionate reductase [Caenispirillum salinarum]EKV26368.1 Octaheme tetrathionate reductase [Caenispirillum salinarum AK4]
MFTMFRPGTRTGLRRAALLLAAAVIAAAPVHAGSSTADHSKFEQLQKPFATGPDVTEACLDCHTETGQQVMHSVHWTWAKENARTGRVEGKLTTINSFCGSPISNEPR